MRTLQHWIKPISFSPIFCEQLTLIRKWPILFAVKVMLIKICLILGMAIAAQENNIEDLVTNTTGLVCSTILHEL